jgi:hypothetical protein
MHKIRYNTWRGEQHPTVAAQGVSGRVRVGCLNSTQSARCCKLGHMTMLVTHLAHTVDGAFIK